MNGNRTLCLNMIVRDESAVLIDSLTRLCNQIKFDYWVICDTGSTDETVSLLGTFFSEKGISGELLETPWRDFGYNRTLALQHAYGKTEYLLVWDADDTLLGDFTFPTNMSADAYSLTFVNNGSKLQYSRPVLLNNRVQWKYVGVVHEYLAYASTSQGPTSVHYTGNYAIESGRSGKRNQDPAKYLKDAAILQKALETTNPYSSLYGRYLFYCGNSFFNAADYPSCIPFYETTLTSHTWSQEKYVSCLRIFEAYEHLDQREKGIPFLEKAFLYDPQRVECMFRLIRYACIQKQTDACLRYYKQIQIFYETQCTKAALSKKLFVYTLEYTFYLPYYMIIVAERSKEYDLGLKMYEIVFAKCDMNAPEWHLNNLFFNLSFFVEHLRTKEADIQHAFVQSLLHYVETLWSKQRYRLEQKGTAILESLVTVDLPLQTIPWEPKPSSYLILTIYCLKPDKLRTTLYSMFRCWQDIALVDRIFLVGTTECSEFPFLQCMESLDAISEIPTYWIHIEGGCRFVRTMNYVSTCKQVFEKEPAALVSFQALFQDTLTFDDVGTDCVKQGLTSWNDLSIPFMIHGRPCPFEHLLGKPRYAYHMQTCLQLEPIPIQRVSAKASSYKMATIVALEENIDPRFLKTIVETQDHLYVFVGTGNSLPAYKNVLVITTTESSYLAKFKMGLNDVEGIPIVFFFASSLQGPVVPRYLSHLPWTSHFLTRMQGNVKLVANQMSEERIQSKLFCLDQVALQLLQANSVFENPSSFERTVPKLLRQHGYSMESIGTSVSETQDVFFHDVSSASIQFVVSLTSSPSRLPHIEPVLQSLLAQTVKPKAIYLNLPDVFERTGESYTIPSWFSNYTDRVILNRCGKDLGPITKLVPALSRIDLSEDVWIVTADDDIAAIPYTLETYQRIVETTMSTEKRAIGLGGTFFNRTKMYGPSEMMKRVEILEGYGMPAYHRSFFNASFFEYVDVCVKHLQTKRSDDVILSNWLSLHRIVKEQVGIPWCNRGRLFEKHLLSHGMKEDALNRLEPNEAKYAKAYDYLKSCGLLALYDVHDWEFHKGFDSLGNDIHSFPNSTRVEDLMMEAMRIPGCVAFNTVGCFKHMAHTKLHVVSTWKEDGIYVRKPVQSLPCIAIDGQPPVEFPLEPVCLNTVPFYIFQTWQSKQLLPDMANTVARLKSMNPDFKHYLFDDYDCRRFIANYYDKDVLDAFDALVPGAYKADLWRYCVLYKYGGVYLDIKLRPVEGFRLADLCTSNQYCKDIPESCVEGSISLFNGFLVSRPSNPIMMNCIKRILANVRNRYYGICDLEPTGPVLLGSLFHPSEQFDITLVKGPPISITYRDKTIFETYPTYRKELTFYSRVSHYGSLWKERRIYK